MSDCGEYVIDQVTDALTAQWLELWEFTDNTEPKFWFGSRVSFQDRSAVIVGMQWRSQGRHIYTVNRKCGWYYVLLFSPGAALQLLHEDSLSALAD